jgi:hypothetical protein
MKCSNPDCRRGIGLVSHRRGWFSKPRYCSRKCRDDCVVERPTPLTQAARATYPERLLAQPKAHALALPVVREAAR